MEIMEITTKTFQGAHSASHTDLQIQSPEIIWWSWDPVVILWSTDRCDKLKTVINWSGQLRIGSDRINWNICDQMSNQLLTNWLLDQLWSSWDQYDNQDLILSVILINNLCSQWDYLEHRSTMSLSLHIANGKMQKQISWAGRSTRRPPQACSLAPPQHWFLFDKRDFDHGPLRCSACNHLKHYSRLLLLKHRVTWCTNLQACICSVTIRQSSSIVINQHLSYHCQRLLLFIIVIIVIIITIAVVIKS